MRDVEVLEECRNNFQEGGDTSGEGHWGRAAEARSVNGWLAGGVKSRWDKSRGNITCFHNQYGVLSDRHIVLRNALKIKKI